MTLETVRATSHEIGKICIPDHILNKPGKLNRSEWRIMRRHSEMGADILSRIGVSERVSFAVLAHHERYDRRGYPRPASRERTCSWRPGSSPSSIPTTP